jgi:2-polyprenyl-3-methyl-5-hydroxy-6-metoxy-1,4-benzoquinol methylase
MPGDELHRYYSEDFGSHRHMQGQIVNATVNTWAFERMLKSSGGTVRNLLDVGTGYGFFLKAVHQRLDIDVTGVELSRTEANYGNTELGLDIRNVMLSEAEVTMNHFDMVTAFEVIEHIADPRGFVAELAKYVKPGGYMLIMTDNFESKVARGLGAGFPKWIPHSHISHFAPSTLERVVADAGLVIIHRMSYTPWELVLRNFRNRLLCTKKNPSSAFNFSVVLQTEMKGTFPLFRLRLALNKILAQMRTVDSLDGALMYVLARKSS